jgi:hypothetical protein
MLSVYTRHHQDCKYACDKLWRRCNCPKWIWGAHQGRFIRQSAKTHSWEQAEENRQKLELVLPPEECANYMYIGSARDLELYKHRYTRRYLNISTDGRRFYFYAGENYVEVAKSVALDHVRS